MYKFSWSHPDHYKCNPCYRIINIYYICCSFVLRLWMSQFRLEDPNPFDSQLDVTTPHPSLPALRTLKTGLHGFTQHTALEQALPNLVGHTLTVTHNILPGVLPAQDIYKILQHPHCYRVVLEIKHTVYLWVLFVPNLYAGNFTKCY
jgi:hypothetical protein